MGNQASMDTSILNPLMKTLVPWTCNKCNKYNVDNVRFCFSCTAKNPAISGGDSFIKNVLCDIKTGANQLKSSLLTPQQIKSKFDKHFASNNNDDNNTSTVNTDNDNTDNTTTNNTNPDNINDNAANNDNVDDNDNKNDNDPINDNVDNDPVNVDNTGSNNAYDNDNNAVNVADDNKNTDNDVTPIRKPKVLPVIHIERCDSPQEEANCLQIIDYNISIVRKYGFDGIWLIDHNFTALTNLVKIIKAVRCKYPSLFIGANFLGGDSNKLIPFLISQGLIVRNNKNQKNILNGLWVDDGGIRIVKDYEKKKNNTADIDDEYTQKYDYMLAALRCLQFKYYGIRDFLLFGGVDFKYQGQIHKTSDVLKYQKEIGLLGKFASCGFMDVVCTSGKGTGKSADVDKMKAFRESTVNRACLAVASGVTPQNVINYIGYTDFILVATGISKDFHTFDENKCKQLRKAIDTFSFKK